MILPDRRFIIGNKLWPSANEIWVKSDTQLWTVGCKIGGWGGTVTINSAVQDGGWWKYDTSGGNCGEKAIRDKTEDFIFGSNIKLLKAFQYGKGTLVMLSEDISLYNNTQNVSSWAVSYKACYVLDNLVDSYKSITFHDGKTPYSDVLPVSQYPITDVP